MKYYLTQEGREFLEEATFKQKIGATALALGALGGAHKLGSNGPRPTAIVPGPSVTAPARPKADKPSSPRRVSVQPDIPSTKGEKPRDPDAPKPTPMQYRAGAGGKKKSEFVKWHVGQNRGKQPEGTQGDIMAQKGAKQAYDKANLVPVKDKK
tara:strand:+ start:900 stop:1358 length:459 start_codon:yes stop_codon:yes gene_type:complete